MSRVIDADCHVLEPPDIWANWLPKALQDKAPKLAKDADGGDGWLFAGAVDPDPIGLVATPGMAWDDFRWTGVTYEEARAGCYNGAERLKDMDIDGVSAEVLFPPQRTIGHFLGDADDDFVRAGVDAYNNFLFDEFAAPDRSRLIGMAQIGSTGVDDAVDTLRKARARGFKGVVISCWPSAGESISEADDPFWAAAQDEGMPVCIHINLQSRAARLAVREAAARGQRASFYGTGDKRSTQKAVGGLGSVFTAVPATMATMIMTGTFDRFPELHVAWIETGVGWIPHFLEQMDDRYWRNRGWGQVELQMAPSEYWYRNMSATFITDRSGIELRQAAGIDNIMWSSDYPHHGNDWPYSRKTIADMMGHIPRDERLKIQGGNAARIWNLDA